MGSLKNFDLETEIEELRTSLKAKNAWPMWKVEDAVAKNRPNAKAVPFLWNFKSFEKDLHEAGRLVSEKEATRRVAMLVNPAFGEFLARQFERRHFAHCTRTWHSLHDRYHIYRLSTNQSW